METVKAECPFPKEDRFARAARPKPCGKGPAPWGFTDTPLSNSEGAIEIVPVPLCFEHGVKIVVNKYVDTHIERWEKARWDKVDGKTFRIESVEADEPPLEFTVVAVDLKKRLIHLETDDDFTPMPLDEFEDAFGFIDSGDLKEVTDGNNGTAAAPSGH